MPWQVEDYHRTLYIVKVPKSEGRTFYRIHPIMTVVNKNTGQTYAEFIPSKGLLGGFADIYDFDAVVFINEPSTARTAEASQLQLHCSKVQAHSGS